MLAEQGMEMTSIPAQGRFVRLRRAANVASGGVPTPVLEAAHPDNLELAARAARTLRLDLAGVDLLIPDIRRSWLEGGAAICEVNAQPQLSPSLPELLLKKLLPKQGRIPVVLIFGEDRNSAFSLRLASSLAAGGRKVGRASRNGADVGDTVLRAGVCNIHSSIEALFLSPDVEIAIICQEEVLSTSEGLPIDHFDVMVLLEQPAIADTQGGLNAWRLIALSLANTCRGPIFAEAGVTDWSRLLDTIDRDIQPASHATIIADIVARLG
jgi:cyanophycin synthetase